jgi:hypothetical protein
MVQWYNHIFYKDGDQPKPDALITNNYTSLPTLDESSDIPNEEAVAEKSKLDFMFRQNFVFAGLPTDPTQQQTFFTQRQNRESDPAGIRQIDETLSVKLPIYEGAKTILSIGVVTPLKAAYNMVLQGLSNLPDSLNLRKRFFGINPYKANGGSGKNTKKRHSQNRRQKNRTQRRLLAVDDR